jgi:hypothetical protein
MDQTFLLLLLLGLAIGFWLSAMRARERAISCARTACARLDLQLLDETVILTRLRPAISHGRLRLRRHYQFDFMGDDNQRRTGDLELVGDDLVKLSLDRTLMMH